MKSCLSKFLFIVLALIMFCFTGSSVYAAEAVYGELISNNTFSNGVGIPWKVSEVIPAKADFNIKDGKYNITINNPGTNRWDIAFHYKDLVIEKGHTYTVKFTVCATADCSIYAKIGDMNAPFNEYWNYNRNWDCISLKANVPQTITDQFTMTLDTAKKCEFAFHIADSAASYKLPYTVSFDDIYLSDPQYVRIIESPKPVKSIRVNQEGYFPGLSKVATLVSDSPTPVEWKLLNGSGAAVAQGQSSVRGFDKSSGDNIHLIDFSKYTIQGKGYRLISEGSDSVPFDIRTDLYSTMKYDAMKYFYHNRGGINIKMPYADSYQLVRDARNFKDILAGCPSSSYKESYSLDLTGGWYDDILDEKSPVHSGVATWMLMNEFEHALYYGDIVSAPYADGTLNIPESGNGYPDILDEARYNLKTLLNMQVPKGYAFAGMVHHGVAFEAVAQDYGSEEAVYQRYLAEPTTAATLNLSALAAQGARLWKPYDAGFAEKCLTAAEAAWDAAVARPDVYANAVAVGGGNNLKDEFYWAACELYTTTGKTKYLEYIQNSEHYLTERNDEEGDDYYRGYLGCFDWGNTAGLGTITLALVPNGLPASDIARAKSNITEAADKFISIADSQGYRVPIKERDIMYGYLHSFGFPYFSNAFVLNEAVVMAYANDFNKEKGIGNLKYLNGISEAMDYILGRNPNVQSYITGYGENPIKNPHHSFWKNGRPEAPAGCLSSGPDSGLQDSWVKGAGLIAGEVAPEKCFADNRESWSTNDVGIKSNAPLAWISAYLDQNGPEIVPPVDAYGDVNGDKAVDAIDLALVKKFVMAQEGVFINIRVADVNGDGSVNAIDYALIKQYLLGKITVFPAEI